MLNLSHIGGSFVDWGIFASLLTIVMGGITVWIKGMPDRGRVQNERKVIDLGEMAQVIANYEVTVKGFRDEVHGLRNELQAVRGELLASDKVGDQRHNWISDLMFIIDLLISEVERLDPKSATVKQARAMLKRMGGTSDDAAKSDAMNIAEAAARDARQTVRSTEHAVEEIGAKEAKEGK